MNAVKPFYIPQHSTQVSIYIKYYAGPEKHDQYHFVSSNQSAQGKKKKKTWKDDETDKELREDLILKYLQLYT